MRSHAQWHQTQMSIDGSQLTLVANVTIHKVAAIGHIPIHHTKHTVNCRFLYGVIVSTNLEINLGPIWYFDWTIAIDLTSIADWRHKWFAHTCTHTLSPMRYGQHQHFSSESLAWSWHFHFVGCILYFSLEHRNHFFQIFSFFIWFHLCNFEWRKEIFCRFCERSAYYRNNCSSLLRGRCHYFGLSIRNA